MALFSKDDNTNNRPASRSRRITASAPRNPKRAAVTPAPIPGAYQAAAYSAPRPITAAAVQMKLDDKGEVEKFKQRRKGGSTDWQHEAWELSLIHI